VEAVRSHVDGGGVTKAGGTNIEATLARIEAEIKALHADREQNSDDLRDLRSSIANLTTVQESTENRLANVKETTDRIYRVVEGGNGDSLIVKTRLIEQQLATIAMRAEERESRSSEHFGRLHSQIEEHAAKDELSFGAIRTATDLERQARAEALEEDRQRREDIRASWARELGVSIVRDALRTLATLVGLGGLYWLKTHVMG